MSKVAKGIIALDVDGTVADETHMIPASVHDYLFGLHRKGWVIVFITGRTFSFGYRALESCKFPYYFSIFNGAQMLKMPEHEVVKVHDLPPEIIPVLVAEEIDPLLHDKECCYWRPDRHDPETRAAFAERQQVTGEKWVAVENFDEVGRKSLAYAKIFGPKEKLHEIADKLEGVAKEIIHDPLRPDCGILLVTNLRATKGGSLRDMREMLPPNIPAIAAGDDFNDVTMLDEADFGIAMASGPEEIRRHADLVAKDGIVAALNEAIRSVT